MPNLDISRLYSDGEVFTEAHLDQIRADIEALFNSTLIDDDNIQNSGITGSTKLVAASVTAETLAAASVSSSKIVDDAVTTDKIADDAVTNAKVASDAVTSDKISTTFGSAYAGMVISMHTYNSALQVPRGWMICNGDIVNETNYDAQHGSGSYAADSVAASSLLSKYLPDLSDKFVRGVTSTTQTGASAITATGNTGHTIDLEHAHTLPVHTHNSAYRAAATGSYVNVTPVGYQPSASGTYAAPNELSSTQSIKPDSVELLYIMRVI